MTIGRRIAQKRNELGLSQEALGAELGVSRQAIYKWEADAARFSASAVPKTYTDGMTAVFRAGSGGQVLDCFTGLYSGR